MHAIHDSPHSFISLLLTPPLMHQTLLLSPPFPHTLLTLLWATLVTHSIPTPYKKRQSNTHASFDSSTSSVFIYPFTNPYTRPLYLHHSNNTHTHTQLPMPVLPSQTAIHVPPTPCFPLIFFSFIPPLCHSFPLFSPLLQHTPHLLDPTLPHSTHTPRTHSLTSITDLSIPSPL